MNNLKNKIIELGASLVGFSDLKGYLPQEIKEYHNGISIAIKLDEKIIDDIKNGPTSEYAEYYLRINSKLNLIAVKTKKMLEAEGFKACIVEAAKTVDRKNLKGMFQHKTAATRAGLGWIGKCDLLVTKKYGPRVRLVTVLTNAPLEFGDPITQSECGGCKVCVENCPVGAPKGVNWKVNLQREDIYDVKACYRRVTANKKIFEHRICGICISVCPRGKIV